VSRIKKGFKKKEVLTENLKEPPNMLPTEKLNDLQDIR
jgi:hypothetical protein